MLDPSAVVFNGKIFLYYSGLGDGEDSVGLAVSKDGNNFTKYEKNPVLTGFFKSLLASYLGHYFFSKIFFFFLNAFADFKTGEAGNGIAFGSQQLANC